MRLFCHLLVFVVCFVCFSVFCPVCQIGDLHKMCDKCIGNEILAGPSHRSSDTHISFSWYSHFDLILLSFISHCVFALTHLQHTLFPFPTHFSISTETHFQDTSNAFLGSGTRPELAWTECLKSTYGLRALIPE